MRLARIGLSSHDEMKAPPHRSSWSSSSRIANVQADYRFLENSLVPPSPPSRHLGFSSGTALPMFRLGKQDAISLGNRPATGMRQPGPRRSWWATGFSGNTRPEALDRAFTSALVKPTQRAPVRRTELQRRVMTPGSLQCPTAALRCPHGVVDDGASFIF
jgi:hypothetical protein